MKKFALILGLVALVLSSCVSKKKYDEAMANAAAQQAALQKALDAEKMDKEKLEGELATLQKNLNMSKEEVQKLGEEIRTNNQRIARLEQAITNTFSGYEGITTERRNGRLYIKVGNDILYKPGRAVVDKDSKGTIDRLASVFNTVPELSVMVEGHTDNDPVKIHKASFKDNWELSTARANNVVRALTDAGVTSGRLTASGRGETVPVASNDTKEGKAQNRRTEFIVYPDSKVQELYQFYKNDMGGSTN
ncbi:MAG: OmpA family protein [Bacteroidia bacterium]